MCLDTTKHPPIDLEIDPHLEFDVNFMPLAILVTSDTMLRLCPLVKSALFPFGFLFYSSGITCSCYTCFTTSPGNPHLVLFNTEHTTCARRYTRNNYYRLTIENMVLHKFIPTDEIFLSQLYFYQ